MRVPKRQLVRLMPEARTEYAQDQVIRERIRRFDAGKAETIPASEVFSELDKRLKKLRK